MDRTSTPNSPDYSTEPSTGTSSETDVKAEGAAAGLPTSETKGVDYSSGKPRLIVIRAQVIHGGD